MKLDSHARQASITFQLDLGQQVSPSQHVRTTARDRRRQRRADARISTEAGNVKNTLEKDVDIKEVEAVKGSAAAVEIIVGNAVEKTAEDAETD